MCKEYCIVDKSHFDSLLLYSKMTTESYLYAA